MTTIQNQNFGTEIELTGITRQAAARVIANYFGTTSRYIGDGCYSERDTAELEACKAKLAEATVAKENIVKAIEAGIFTKTTKARLDELEMIEQDMAVRIRVQEKHLRIDVSKDDIISWLETIRDGDVNDRNFQETMIDAFLIRAYLYDDGHLKLVFRYTKEPGELTVPLEIFEGKEDSESLADSSTKSFTTPPQYEVSNSDALVAGSHFGSV